MNAKKFFYVLLGVCALCVAAIVGSYYYGMGEITKEAASVSKLLAEYDAQVDNIDKLQKNDIDQEEIEEIDALLERLLPQEKNQETLVVDIIYTATAEARIPTAKISSFAFSGGSEPNALSGTEKIRDIPGTYEYPFTLTLQEINYSSLIRLLREIETNGRIIQVANVQIVPDKTNTANLSSVSLSMKAYLRP